MAIKNQTGPSAQYITYKRAASIVSELKRIGYQISEVTEYNMANGQIIGTLVGSEEWLEDSDTHIYTATVNGSNEELGLLAQRFGTGGLMAVCNELEEIYTSQNVADTKSAAYTALRNLPGVQAALDALFTVHFAG